ncbi:OmpH family outer membrane protein [bacterium]|nr:OmpH family outer membrane protein [bacterium]
MNRSTRLILPLLALLLATGAAAADKPLAVIDSERIVQEYPAAKDAQEQYQRFLQEKELEVNDRERELQSLAESIESQKMLLGDEALRAKVDEFERAKADYFNFRQQLDTQAESEYQAKIQPIIDQVKLIVERIGKEEGYGLIVDTASLTTVYLDPEVDLTDRVLQALVRGVEE